MAVLISIVYQVFMRQFPYEFDSTKEILYYPQKPDQFAGDILEIGPGKGEFLHALAQNRPDKRIVAIEIGTFRFNKISTNCTKKGIKNVTLIKGDARIVLPTSFKENTFEKIFVLFPDPWPKKKHAFRRLMQIEFIWLLAHNLKPGGELIFGSDVASYTQWVENNLSQVNIMEKIPSDPKSFSELNMIANTYFEDKWRKENRSIHYLWYKKK